MEYRWCNWPIALSPLLLTDIKKKKPSSFSANHSRLKLIMQGALMEASQIKKPALSAVWHDKHAVKAPSAHTVGNYIISPQLSNGDGVIERTRYTKRDRWTSHVATESLQPHWSNTGRVPLFTGVVVISPFLKDFLLLLCEDSHEHCRWQTRQWPWVQDWKGFPLKMNGRQKRRHATPQNVLMAI